MEHPKHIENKNIPPPQQFKVYPEFYIHDYQLNESTCILKYTVEGRGTSMYFFDKRHFEQFPKLFEVQSGSWYGDEGRWSPSERYDGSILCENVKDFKIISKVGKNYRFEVTKPLLSSYKKVVIENDIVGLLEFKCTKLIPKKFSSFIYCTDNHEWMSRKEAMDYLNSQLIL